MATGKKGSSAPAGEQKQKKPAYEVHIDKTFDDPGKSLRAVASMTIGDFSVHGIKLFQNENGTFVLHVEKEIEKICHLILLPRWRICQSTITKLKKPVRIIPLLTSDMFSTTTIIIV